MTQVIPGRLVHFALSTIGMCFFQAALAQDACVALPPLPETIEVADEIGVSALGDIDLDGDVDVVVTTGGADPGIAVVRNLGGGRFDTPELLGIGTNPWSVQLNDLDGDGDLDVVVPDEESISVLRNEGPGTFAFSQEIVVRPSGVQFGDADGDGDLDLFVMQPWQEHIRLFLNDGLGGFTEGGDISIDDDADDFAAGDADGDGIADLLVHYFFSRTTAMVYGVGDGSYESPVNRSYTDKVRQVELADIDGDGDLDEIANGILDNIRVRRNMGGRVFAPAVVTEAVSSERSGLEARDLNGDGAADLVQPLRDYGLVVHLATGDGFFGQAHVYDTNGETLTAGLGDIDGDGDKDVLATNFRDRNLQILRNSGDGRFSQAFGFSSELGATAMIVFDFDVDGTPDIATGEGVGPTVQDLAWYRGVGGGLHELAGQLSLGSAAEALASADVDGNGTPDLIARSASRVHVMLNDGAGGFERPTSYFVGGNTPGLDAGDIDGDGDVDIVTANEDTRRIVFLRNNGDGTFADAEPVSPNTMPWDVLLVDVNDDGDLDVLVTTEIVLFQRIVVMYNDGAGSFVAVEGPFVRADRGALAADDMDGDGDVDVVIGHRRGVEVFANDGGGVLTEIEEVDASGIRGIALGDFNGDRTTDVAAIRESGENLVILTNAGDGTLQQAAARAIIGSSFQAELRSIDTADMDQDGLQDLTIGLDLDGRTTRVRVLLMQGDCPACRIDLDGDEQLTIFDFLAFQNLFQDGDLAADFDGDGALTLFDFLAFQNEFAAGCE